MTTNRVRHSSVRVAQQRSNEAPAKVGDASARHAAKMQRTAESAEIKVITRGHGKVAKNPGAGRILTHLARIDLQMGKALARATTLKELADAPRGSDEKSPITAIKPDPVAVCRATAFAAEMYMRVANKFLGSAFKQHFVAVKELEDKLGALGYALDMLTKAAAKTGARDVENYWTFRVSETATIAIDCIKKNWLPKDGELTATQQIARSMRDFTWPEGKHDRKLNAAALAWEAEHVVDADLDMNVLNQMHSLRRKCRKVSILGAAMNGACVLTDKHTPKPYRDIVKTPAADKPFAKLAGSPNEKNPVEFSRGMWITMSEMIEELGDLKDNREQLEAVEHALRAVRGLGAEEAKDEALALLGHTRADEKAWIGRAKEIQRDSRVLFKDIAEQLRTQC